ncbi:MAG: hypothetical protein N3B13_12490, partial [Deltaproteobacteria bacterium]|nr:hypothetical protein [Deltaproteobacteria bacterium]
VVIILSLSYLYAQNIIAGIESSRTMLAFPKEEIRNLNADIMQNSVIIGDDAYDVEEGFIIFEQGTKPVNKEPEKRSRTQEIKSLASLILENFKNSK